MTQSQALEALAKANLTVSETKTVNSATIPVDRVVGTDPPVDTQVKPGDTVVLQISNGKTTVPDCTGKTQSDCSTILKNAGLVMGTVTEETSDAAAGTVIRTEPGVDATVDQNTQVTVVVAKALEKKPLPDFRGKSASEARSWLDGAGMIVNEVYESSTSVAENRVIDTNPSAGAELTVGQTVTIRVSSGPGPTPTPDPSQTP
jgi:serine/threonine-protein kinase